VHVEDLVAVVGDEPLAIDRLSAQGDQLSGDIRARHRNHLHRQRKFAEHVHQLGFVGDADEAPRCGGHDLLARQRAPTTLDQASVTIRLVGAVDVQVQIAGRVEVEYVDTVTAQPRGGALGARDCAPDAHLLRSQRIDEVIHGGAGADAEDGVLLDVGEGGEGGLLLGCIGVHGRVLAAR